MSRLIYADELLSYIDRVKNSGLGKQKTIEYITKYISNMPTAFDVDKVAVQLEAQSEMNLKKGLIEVLPDEARPYLKAVESFDKAIKIVMEGGIDEEIKS